ncbi:daunorubicin resistance protein DrrA family ABC transporter ATP-binding protein [Salinispora vitiensis]|uniref:daunorubicin resistance protein DrrA family ABC transporter ATP-binding protein n=1 Tax=Salinispora vitiensis TaxID=999544 RepID=UPI000368E16A|nr:daunorubicin resistance protein DrrA family ABC transporter ATP-binding protein [Salinispora vitiensis]
MPPAIAAERLVKNYGKVKALDGFDLEVPTGSILGLLGPNGAGKTTAVRVFATLVRPDTGRAFVAGYDVATAPDAVRRSIGLSGQFAAIDENLTGRQNLDLVGRLYHLGARRARARAAELLDRFDLTDAADRLARTYSGGMRRRLDLAGALVAAPPVLFLDEPTTGLDLPSRRHLWEHVAHLAAEGTTVLLTTQYLEEAEALATSIAVMEAGRVIATGTPDELRSKVGGGRVEAILADVDDLASAATCLRRLDGGDPLVDVNERRVSIPADDAEVLIQVVRSLDEHRIKVVDLALRRPTLDDVFLALTGGDAAPRPAHESEKEAAR